MSNRVFSLPAPVHKKQEKLSHYPPFQMEKKEEQPKKGKLGKEGREDAVVVCVVCVLCVCVCEGVAESNSRQISSCFSMHNPL